MKHVGLDLLLLVAGLATVAFNYRAQAADSARFLGCFLILISLSRLLSEFLSGDESASQTRPK